jgi:DNA-binding CsgD family transcriptional regulator/PAS domain-containing protein
VSIRISAYLREAVTRLRTSDLEDVVAFLGDLAELDDAEPFPTELLGRLAQLVPSDSALFNERDVVRRRLVDQSYWCPSGVGDYGDEDGDPSGVDEWEFVVHHPVNAYRRRTGYLGALRDSDFYDRRARLSGKVPAPEYWTYWGIVDNIGIRLESSSTHTVNIGLESKTRDFTERDRLVLDQVRPHLAAQHRNARLRSILASALAAFESISDQQTGPAVVLIAPDGSIDFASPAGLRLLAQYLGGSGARLPPALEAWWRTRPTSSFTQRQDGYRLVVDAVGASALLVSEEPAPTAPLTSREWDVMRCVDAGQTNEEIARLLSVTPSTVKKHLEHVYAKLGVRTRTAALARLRPRLTRTIDSREEHVAPVRIV